MWTAEDIAELTDPATVSRGRAYVRSGRVVAVGQQGGAVLAEVQGSQLYRVRLGDRSWECDCPVGVTGAFCKHCAAVVIAVEEGSGTDNDDQGEALSRGAEPSPDRDPVDAWLDGLAAPDLRALIRGVVARVDGGGDLLAQEYLAASDDLGELAAEVDRVLRPRRSFYEYGQANSYARAAQGVLDILDGRRDRPSVELLTIVQRAITLTVRVIVRSDDSSGYQGDQVRGLLDLHRVVASGLAGDLDRPGRRALATWLHAFRFAGKQDFFEVDVDAYAEVLRADGVERYRGLVETSAAAGGEDFAVTYARGRLAILDRDAEGIVQVFGGDLSTQHRALHLVAALDEAGMPRRAVQYAELGLSLPRTHRTHELVDRLVLDAVSRGDLDAALTLRRADFRAAPGARSLGAYRSAAEAVGTWATERPDAESLLASHAPHEWLGVLMSERRDDEAWDFATAHPADAQSVWETLCSRRVVTAPADTVPVYRRLVEQALRAADRRSYVAACRLLVRLGEASRLAGLDGEFATFLGQVAETGRRRPTFIHELRRAQLIDGPPTSGRAAGR
ncbi:SWIM zinc finger family protein [soil metagenome]